jgi:histidinol-phosphatase (PHP family)
VSKKTKAKAKIAKKPAKAAKTPPKAKKPIKVKTKAGSKAKPIVKSAPKKVTVKKVISKKKVATKGPVKKAVAKKGVPANKVPAKSGKGPKSKSALRKSAPKVSKAGSSKVRPKAKQAAVKAEVVAKAEKLVTVKEVKVAKVAPVKEIVNKVPPPAPEPVAAITEEVVEVPKKVALKTTGKVSVAYESPVRPTVPPIRRDAPVKTGSTVKDGGAIFYDSHMHTPLCKHAYGEPEEYAAQGLRAGLRGIIFTCHCPMPNAFWPTVRMDEAEFDAYVAMVGKATQKFKGKLDVWLGLESEYYPGYEKYIEELHQRADFHFILGSVHWQSKEYLGKFENGTIEGFRRTYFNHLADSAESGLYDCLGHPDLVKNYHPDSWCFPILKEHVSRCLDRIAATGVAMELNTSGLNKSYHEMNPGNEFLGMMAERGIPLVIGSDAHRSARVGEHFIQALENAKAAGYKEVNYFEWRKRKALKLDAVLESLKKYEAAKAI